MTSVSDVTGLTSISAITVKESSYMTACQPTMYLRMLDGKTLQQKWLVTEFHDGLPPSSKQEWRDIPVVKSGEDT